MLQLLTSSLLISNQDELVKPDEERDRRVLRHKYQQLRDPKRYAQLVYLAGQSDSPTGSSSVVRESVCETECKRYNTKLMRLMINKKMRKSPTFSEFLLGKNNSVIVGAHKPVPPPEGIAFDFFS